MNKKARAREDSNAFFQDFTDFKPRSSGESGSEDEEGVDSDVRDTIYAHIFFTSANAQTQKKKAENVTDSCQKPAGREVSVSLVANESQQLSKRLKSGSRHLTRADIKAKRKLKRERRKLKRSKLLEDNSLSESDVTLDKSSNPPVAISVESPLATSDIRASSSTRRGSEEQEATRREVANNETKSKGSKVAVTSDTPDVIVISDSDQPTHSVITVSGSEGGSSSGSESSLHFDALVELLDKEESAEADHMELCDKDEMDQEGITDEWAISKKDLLGREAYERLFVRSLGDRPGRYYNDKSATKCTNCKQRGHLIKSCPWPKRHQVCHFCAGVNHMSSRCPQAMCSYCCQPQHRGRSCSGPCSRPIDCGRCFMQGHFAAICPDQWRQFHNTNYKHDEMVTIHPKRQRNSSKIFCYNCADSGHYGFECTKTRPRGYYRPHTPLIAKYDLDLWPPRDVDRIRHRLGIPMSPYSGSSASHSRTLSEPGYSRKRPSQDYDATPPSRKHSKRHDKDPRASDRYHGADQYDRTDGRRHGPSGNYGNHRASRHRDSEPDLRSFIGRQQRGGGQYESHDFPRTPLSPPLLPPPSPHSHMPPPLPPSHRHAPPLPPSYGHTPPLPPSHRHTPLLPSPHQHHRRFSDISDYRQSHEQGRGSHDRDRRRSHDHYRQNDRREDYHTSDRGFRGSPHTARMLDNHSRQQYRH